MPGASEMSFTCSPEKPLVISVSLPARSTMTVCGSPVPVIAARKPSAIDSTAVKTITTPAMPMTATVDEPSRCGIDRSVTPVTAMIWESQFMRVIHFAQRVDDLEPACLERRQEAGAEPEQQDERRRR